MTTATKQKLTVKQQAEKLGISVSTFNRRKRQFNSLTSKQQADTLGISLSTLYRRKKAEVELASIAVPKVKASFKFSKTTKAKKKADKKADKKAYNKQYYQNNKDKFRAYNKQRYQDNKAELQAYHKQYYQDNKAELQAYNKQYYQDNKAEVQAYNKQYYQDNKAECLARDKRYRETFEGWISSSFNGMCSRARRKGLAMEITAEYLKEVYYEAGGLDVFTKEPVTFKRNDVTRASFDRIDNTLGYIEGNIQLTDVQGNVGKYTKTNQGHIAYCKKVAAENP